MALHRPATDVEAQLHFAAPPSSVEEAALHSPITPREGQPCMFS